MKLKYCSYALGILSICLILPGCILAPALDSLRQAGVTQGDREALLSKDMKRYQEAVYWGKVSEALNYATDEGRPQVNEAFKKRGQDERVVDSKVDSIEFTDNSYAAEVVVSEKYYKVPVYLVNTRVQKQNWNFSMVSGWKISNLTVEEPRPGQG